MTQLQLHDSARQRQRTLQFTIILFLLIFIAYLPAMWGGYTWDDDAWLLDNGPVHAWNGLRQIWNFHHQELQYYPVVFTAFWIEHKLWGLAPAGYHVINILTHAIGALLLWRSLRRLGVAAPWFGALLWAIHPVQVDSVAWVTELKNTLSGCFYFAALLLYLRFLNIGSASRPAPGSRVLFYAASLLCFMLGLLTKTVICTLPAALVLIVLWKFPRSRWIKSLLLTIPLFVVGFGMALLSSRQEAGLVQQGAVSFDLTLPQRCIVAGLDIWHYLYTLIVPFPLVPIPPKWDVPHDGLLGTFAILAIAATTGALFMLRRRITAGPLIAWLFFIATLSPALGFIPFYTMLYTYVAPHYQYLACAGPLVLFAELLARIARSNRLSSASATPDRLLYICMGIIAVAFMGATLFYNWIYQSDTRMWEWNVRENPAAWNARHNLAIAYINAGRDAEAESLLKTALQQYPDDARVHRTLAQLYAQEGRFNEAAPQFNRSLQLNDHDPRTYQSLGQMYLRMHEIKPALAALAKAVALQPDRAINHYNLAQALARAGKLQNAAAEYRIAVSLNPNDFATRYNYGNVLLDLGQFAAAVDQYQAAIQLRPNNADAWYNLALAYHRLGRDAEAADAQRRAQSLDAATPQSAEPSTQP